MCFLFKLLDTSEHVCIIIIPTNLIIIWSSGFSTKLFVKIWWKYNLVLRQIWLWKTLCWVWQCISDIIFYHTDQGWFLNVSTVWLYSGQALCVVFRITAFLVIFWHERSALQSVAVRRSTGNDVSGHYFHHYFLLARASALQLVTWWHLSREHLSS